MPLLILIYIWIPAQTQSRLYSHWATCLIPISCSFLLAAGWWLSHIDRLTCKNLKYLASWTKFYTWLSDFVCMRFLYTVIKVCWASVWCTVWSMCCESVMSKTFSTPCRCWIRIWHWFIKYNMTHKIFIYESSPARTLLSHAYRDRLKTTGTWYCLKIYFKTVCW